MCFLQVNQRLYVLHIIEDYALFKWVYISSP